MGENTVHNESDRNDKLSLAIVLAVLLALVLTLISFANLEGQFRAKPTRLTLLPAGCEYVRQHSSLVPNMNTKTGGCEVDAHYVQNLVGSGGMIFYGPEDQQRLSISDAVVVGAASVWEPIQPWTHHQKIAAFLFLAAVIFLMVMIFVLSAVTKSRSE